MIWLIFAHYIGDWGLQSTWMAENKNKYFEVMFAHCMIWTGCVCIGLEYLGIYHIWKVIFLFVGHWIVDKWKADRYKSDKDMWMLHVDQVAHILQLIIVYYI